MRQITIAAAAAAMALTAPSTADAATYLISVTGELSGPTGWVNYRSTTPFATGFRAGDKFSASYTVDISSLAQQSARPGISSYKGIVSDISFSIGTAYSYQSNVGSFALDILNNLRGQSGIGTSAWIFPTTYVPVDFGTGLPIDIDINIEGYIFGRPLSTTSTEENFANILQFDYVSISLWLESGSVMQSFDVLNATASVTAVPEPATWVMMMLGFGAMGFAMRRKNLSTSIWFA